MITTKGVKLKEIKDKKLTILTTGDVKPIEFVVKGQANPMDKRMITTSNVDQFQRDLIRNGRSMKPKRKQPSGERRKLQQQ